MRKRTQIYIRFAIIREMKKTSSSLSSRGDSVLGRHYDSDSEVKSQVDRRLVSQDFREDFLYVLS